MARIASCAVKVCLAHHVGQRAEDVQSQFESVWVISKNYPVINVAIEPGLGSTAHAIGASLWRLSLGLS